MRRELLLWPIVAAIVAGGIAGGSVAWFVSRGAGDGEERGMVVTLGSNLGYGQGDEPWCSEFFHFCVSKPREGEQPLAFYTYTTHDFMRRHGCEVRWVPREKVVGLLDVIGDASGAYRDPCAGSTFDRLGKRVFGPAGRNLDRFAIEVRPDKILVDTRRLICGQPPEGREQAGCDFAPRVD